MGIANFERHPLLFGPSPVHRLDRLTRHLGGADVWAKREDCNSGIAFGGNKTRKLEYLVAEALAQGCDTLVSIGGVQSNHTRQVAAVAAHVGLKCVLVQESWVDWPDSVYDKVGNILISRLAGADVRLVKAGFGIGFKQSWDQALAEIEASGGKPYAIPAGASDHRLGGLGFANWAFELDAQERELAVFFDTIIVCSVTGSTQAGMVAGFAALEEAGARKRRVLGIDASAEPAETHAQVTRIAAATAELIGVGRRVGPDDVELDERYHAGTYGIPDEATLDAMRLAARTEGMITDPVSRSGPAAAASGCPAAPAAAAELAHPTVITSPMLISPPSTIMARSPARCTSGSRIAFADQPLEVAARFAEARALEGHAANPEALADKVVQAHAAGGQVPTQLAGRQFDARTRREALDLLLLDERHFAVGPRVA